MEPIDTPMVMAKAENMNSRFDADMRMMRLCVKPNSRKAGQQGSFSPPGGKPLKGLKGGGGAPAQRIQKPKAK